MTCCIQIIITNCVSVCAWLLSLLLVVSIKYPLCRNLLYLKNYEGDVADLGVDFTVVTDDFGETKVSGHYCFQSDCEAEGQQNLRINTQRR